MAFKTLSHKGEFVDRTYRFSHGVSTFLRRYCYAQDYAVIKFQLSKTVNLLRINCGEFQYAKSKNESNYRVHVCHREARKSYYWLQLLKEDYSGDGMDTLKFLLSESEELKDTYESNVKKIPLRIEI